MGPARASEFPSRPKLSWDGRTVPWTDGVVLQHRYAEAVEEWCDYHELLPAASSNHTAKSVRGIVLKSQLYGRARDLVRSIDAALIKSDDGPKHIVATLHQRDAIGVVSHVFRDFHAVVGAKRGDNEAFKNFENRFSVLVSKFHSHGSELNLPEPILAFLLLHAAAMSDHQRISILASISSNLDADVKDEAGKTKTDAAMTTAIKYEYVAAILRQCERDRSQPSNPLGTHAGNPAPSGGGGNGGGGNGGGNGGGGRDKHKRKRKRMTAEEIRQHKMNSQCNFCSSKGLTRYGHWATDHNPDGSLAPHFPSIERSPANANTANTQQQQQNGDDKPGDKNERPAAGFVFLATLSSSSVLLAASAHNVPSPNAAARALGPLVDDGAPFSAIGEVELAALSPSLLYANPLLEGKPRELDGYDTWQYGSGSHRSPAKKILGSVSIYARTKASSLIAIRHLLIQGSSKWVIGRNLTRKCTINHMTANEVCLPHGNNSLPLTDDRFHSFVLLDSFLKKSTPMSPSLRTLSCAAATPRESAATRDWPTMRRIIDKVHRHVCGHASFSDMRTLLTRNDLWSLDTQKYLAAVVRD